MNKEQVIAILSKNTDDLRGFHVKALYLFGSVVRGDAKKASDVDLLVEFEPDARVGLFEFSRLQRMDELYNVLINSNIPCPVISDAGCKKSCCFSL